MPYIYLCVILPRVFIHWRPCITHWLLQCVCMYMWCVIFHFVLNHCVILVYVMLFDFFTFSVMFLMYFCPIVSGFLWLGQCKRLNVIHVWFMLNIISVALFKRLTTSIFDTWLSYLCWCPCNWICQLKHSLHYMNYPVIICKLSSYTLAFSNVLLWNYTNEFHTLSFMQKNLVFKNDVMRGWRLSWNVYTNQICLDHFQMVF